MMIMMMVMMMMMMMMIMMMMSHYQVVGSRHLEENLNTYVVGGFPM